ncbi:hypothetical protein AN618_20330 [Fervidicola ferrireducens]|uniref:Uncharacterized protein n=1 Tax=Fervidicola ferrireducens TaxID=520764 RepID=A0A140L3N7_9FIRM|nr:hypothetical protein [Fervidicola ferrireducens]KXG75162.1 hypothetical protein AN618_20330 [Fervidicola ferrireducens]
MANLNLKCKVENPDQIIDMIARGAITPVEAFILKKWMKKRRHLR